MQTENGTPERAESDGAGIEPGGDGSEASVSPLAIVEGQEPAPQGRDSAGTGEHVSPDEGGGPDSGSEVDQEDSDDSGDAASKPRPKYGRISRQTFRACCIAGNGNRTVIGKALGITYTAVNNRIRGDAELNALYPSPDVDPPSDAPGSLDVMNRNSEDLPAHVEIGGDIDEQAQNLYWAGLKAYGVSEKRLAKIKTLSGLSKDWATHLSISLRSHHQSYDGQLHNLAELADEIDEMLKGKLNEDGTRVPLDVESYTYLAKIRVECVKESGKGVETMLALTEALVRMMNAKDGKGVGPEKAKAGWGPMKKVREAT
jgi:hypothetical protein